MRRLFAAVAASVLVMTLLTACGGGGDDTTSSTPATTDTTSTPPASSPPPDSSAQAGSDYCSAIKAAEAKYSDLTRFDPSQFEEVRNTLSDIGDKAPGSVKAQWAVLNSKFSQLAAAIDALGIELTDLDNPAALASLDPQKVKEFQATIKKLSADDITKASNAITAEVKSDCGVNLGG